MTTTQTFGLRPIKTPDGDIQIREVYYNSTGNICVIEMQVAHPYTGDVKLDTETLKPMYYKLQEFDMYNPVVVKYDPDTDNLTGWTP